MKTGYDQFFKNARKNAASGQPVGSPASQKAKAVKPQRQFSTSNVHFELSDNDLEKQLKSRMGMPSRPKKRRKSIPWKMMGVSFLGVMLTAWGAQNFEEVETYIKRIEISFMGSAFAEEKTSDKKSEKGSEKTSEKGSEKKDGSKVADANAKPGEGEAATEKAAGEGLSNSEIDHLSKLNDRKKELDEKEEELARIEQELQTQKEELEKRLKDLDGVRRGISSVLEEKVRVDEKKLDTLVLIYSDMKAQQAAKVFETMDEDLAVGILGRMKKKNAADIMTLLKSEKAQALTEKFAGYKRK
jgi:flagellar motility protein MotE (MotC chaperone)